MIVPAVSALERTAVYELRYEVLVGEQGILGDHSIDHTRKTVIDAADETGMVLAAWVDGRLAGTVRTNLLRDGPALPFCELLGLHKLPFETLRYTCVSSRLIVRAPWRHSPIGGRLAHAISKYSREAGMKWDYIVVRPAMSPFFARLGYERLGKAEFPGVGPLEAMRINIDAKHLRLIGSPLLDALPDMPSPND